MKNLVVVLFVCSMSYSLEAPYLISATAQGDSSVMLAWRNNDLATQGFIIQRKDSTETAFKLIDSVKSATTAIYLDKKAIKGLITYTYLIHAYNITELSDSSNNIQVTTPPAPVMSEIFKMPKLSVFWDIDISKSVRITITDSSNCEIGYKIYRDDNFSSSFKPVGAVLSANPKNLRDTVVWFDTTVSINNWYNYKVAVFKSNDSVFSNPCSTFTFHSVQANRAIRFEKVGECPINLPGVTFTKTGDSIIIKEYPSPDGKFTLINVKDPAFPKFDGYIDSIILSNYPIETLVSVMLKTGISNSYMYYQSGLLFPSINVLKNEDKIMVTTDTSAKYTMYKISNNTLTIVDSLKLNNNQPYPIKLATGFLPLNDTLLLTRYYYNLSYGTGALIFQFGIVKLTSSGFSLLTTYDAGYGSWPIYVNYYFHGVWNNNIFVSKGKPPILQKNSDTLLVFDVLNSRKIQYPAPSPLFITLNTGLYFSPTENLCIADTVYTNLFMSDIRDMQGYQTALANNCVYRDTVNLVNNLKHIFLDTLNKTVILLFSHKLVVLSYSAVPIGVTDNLNQPSSKKGINILQTSGSSGFIISFPNNHKRAEISLFDLTGRLVDRMRNVTSNTVFWKPKTRSMGCYVITVKSGKEQFSMKFLAHR
jgi:hypothetical protein